MKILVTGGSGYIGTHLLLALLDRGHEVLALDNFANSSIKAIERVRGISSKEFDFLEVDIRKINELTSAFESFLPDAVLHLAGLKSVFESGAEPLKYYDNNCYGTNCLLTVMDSFGCNKIIFSSSATVYGDPIYLPFDEEHPTKPQNPYGRTKLHIEEMLWDWAAPSPKKVAVSLRYFNPVGAHETGLIGESPVGTPANLFPYILEVASSKRDILSIYGNDYDTLDGSGVRDYIHVMDLVAAHTKAIEHSWTGDQRNILNLGTGEGYSVFQVIHEFERVTGRKIPSKVVARRKGDIAVAFADTSLSSQILNWKPIYGLDRMIEDCWRWHLSNPNGY